MKRTLTILTLILIATQAIVCQAQRKRQPSDEERQKWIEEYRQKKHEFIAKELDLTKEQQNAFFPIYDEMDAEIMQMRTEIRDLEKKCEGPNATAEDKDNLARLKFEQKQREGNIEAAYFNRFKNILSTQQLSNLKNAEYKFAQMLSKHRRAKK